MRDYERLFSLSAHSKGEQQEKTQKMSRSVLGKRSEATSVRPAAREAALLCLESQRSALGIPGIMRLRQLAGELGIQFHDPYVQGATLCHSLENVLGQEWQQAAREALTEKQHVQSRQQEVRSARQVQANSALRQMAIERAQRQSQAVATSASEEEQGQMLLPELRLELIEQMADEQPRAVLALYQTNRTFHDAVDYLQHPFYVMRVPGSVPTKIRLPLIEYARLATNFDAHSALELFMSMALCVVKALANIILHAIALVSPPPTGPHVPTESDMTAPVSQVLGGDVAFQLAQWYSWVSWHTIGQTDRNEIPINMAIDQVYGWMAEHVRDARIYISVNYTPYRFILPIGYVSVGRVGNNPDADMELWSDVLWKMTHSETEAQLGHFFPNREALDDLLGTYGVNPSAAEEGIQRMLMPDAQEALQTVVNDHVAGSAGGACARAIRSSPLVPTLTQLDSGLTFMRFDPTGTSVNAHFQSNAIEWALAAHGAVGHPT